MVEEQRPFTNSVTEYSPLLGVVQGSPVASINEGEEKSDFGGHGHSTLKVSSKIAVWNLINDVLGPGTVALPFYLYQAGIGAGVSLLVIFGLVTTYTLEEIYMLYSQIGKKNYPDLCKHVLGLPGYAVVCIAIFGFNFGGLVGQLMLFKSVTPDIMIDFFGKHELFTQTNLILLGLIVFVPLSLFKDIVKFSFVSFLAIVCVFAVTFCVFFRFIFKAEGSYIDPGKGSDVSDDHPYAFVHFSIFSAFGGLTYVYVCHDLSFNVIDSLKNPTRVRYRRVVIFTMISTIITCCLIGISGYLLFFHEVQQNILDSFPTHDVVATIARCFCAFGVTVVVPFSCFMPRVSIISFISSFGPRAKSFANSNVGSALVTMVILGTAVTIAIMVDGVGDVFELVGGVSACMLAFILPPILTMKGVPSKDVSAFRKVMNTFVLVAGVIIMIGTVTDILWLDSQRHHVHNSTTNATSLYTSLLL